MKFKEMKTSNKILFITNIVLAVYALVLFVGGLIFRGNADELSKLMFSDVEIGKTLLATGLGKEDTSAFLQYIFGYLCGVAIIDGLLAYIGIRASKTSKVKFALVLFIIADIANVIIKPLSFETIIFTICLVCLIIIGSNNKKKVDDVALENNAN